MKHRITTLLMLMVASTMVTFAQDKLYADEFPIGDVTLLLADRKSVV